MEPEPDAQPEGGNAGLRPLTDELRQLAVEARALAETEAAYQKSRAAFAGSIIPRVIALAVLSVPAASAACGPRAWPERDYRFA